MSENQQADSQVLHPGSRKLFRHWEKLRAERAYPTRSELQLAHITDLVPNLFVMERASLATGFTFRLLGQLATELVYPMATSDNFLSGWDKFENQLLQDVLNNAHRLKQPALMRMRLTRKSGAMIGIEMLALPFGTANKGTHLLGGIFGFSNLNFERDPVTVKEIVTVRTLWTEHGMGDAMKKSLEAKGAPMLRVIEGGKM